MGGKTNLELITIRVDPKDKKKLEELAEQDKRTLSNFCRLIIEDHLEKQKPKKELKR